MTFMLHSKKEKCRQYRTVSWQAFLPWFLKADSVLTLVVIRSVAQTTTACWELLVVLKSLSVEPFKLNLPQAVAYKTAVYCSP